MLAATIAAVAGLGEWGDNSGQQTTASFREVRRGSSIVLGAGHPGGGSRHQGLLGTHAARFPPCLWNTLFFCLLHCPLMDVGDFFPLV
ncbi:hypothetical protein E2C01_011962 [Portunus trituberculatus]|uniref:Uncharacterized protein n=1 Tax=Portunus trituberculatus TaxID=210409 RepID=A0A5B7DCW1_PORTR|nr:hypothetical protein [Portunus trituberculatus]